MPLLRSWVESANSPDAPFPLNNLPYGVFSAGSTTPRCGVAIGDMILDVAALEDRRLLALGSGPVFHVPAWNEVMKLGPAAWDGLRARLIELLAEGAAERDAVAPHLVPMSDAVLHMPFRVSEYTDFYASRNHAFNVGSMFRDPAKALPPNWLHIPIGYNGRASSVVVSGSEIRRPWGQLKGPDDRGAALRAVAPLRHRAGAGRGGGAPVARRPSGDGGRGRRDDLRLCASERLVRARYPGLGIPAPRARSSRRPPPRRSAHGS